MNPANDYKKVQEAFHRSYNADKKKNIFTKVKMDLEADKALQKYFYRNISEIESWFNTIAPEGKTIEKLRMELIELRNKNWKEIL